MFKELIDKFYYWNRRRTYLKKLQEEAKTGATVTLVYPITGEKRLAEFTNLNHAIGYALNKIATVGVQFVVGIQHGDRFISGRELKQMYADHNCLLGGTLSSAGDTKPIRRG